MKNANSSEVSRHRHGRDESGDDVVARVGLAILAHLDRVAAGSGPLPLRVDAVSGSS